ncbi:hypothetical protein KI387_011588, partial [Taxus chinensis]
LALDTPWWGVLRSASIVLVRRSFASERNCELRACGEPPGCGTTPLSEGPAWLDEGEGNGAVHSFGGSGIPNHY